MYNIIDVVKDLFTGKLKFADKPTTSQRLEICRRCEVRNKKLNVCTICGCFIPFKTRLHKSSCPMDLW